MSDTLAPPAGRRDQPTPTPVRPRDRDVEKVNKVSSIPFVLIHLLPLLAIFTGVTWTAVILCVVLYYVRMFFITAGYHRYFAHRSYRMGRVPQFLMAFGGTMAAQKGPLWWAGHHRGHHKYSDTDLDAHSPQQGFWWSHVGWILCDKYAETPTERIRDFAKYPELRFLNRFDWIGPWLLGFASFLIAGLPGLFIGFFLSTMLLWHGTFTVNSLAHVFGRRRYATEDTSRNNALMVLWTMGEGWHNNHHYFQASARQGFFWWEIDPSYYVLKALSWIGIVKDLKVPPRRILAENRIEDGTFDIGMFRKHWSRANRFVDASSSVVAGRVHSGREAAGEALHARAEAAGEALHARREAIEQSLAAKKAALEGVVVSSLESAEDLARATRRSQRELGFEPN